MLSVAKWYSHLITLIISQMRSNARLPKSLGKRIKKYRTEKGFTQEDLADKVGVSRAYMGYIEQGRNTPSLEVLEKISKILKTPHSKLFD